MIPVVHEDVEELKKWGMGLETMLERCVFCRNGTPYWHRESNTPVCECCAETHSVSEIKKQGEAV